MIPHSTRASIELARTIPARAQAVAVFLHKQSDTEDLATEGLSDAERQVIADLMRAEVVTGKSNEALVHLLPGKNARRLILIGLGNREKFSVECLREAGVALARAVRKHNLASIALLPPPIPESLPGMPDAAAETSRGMELGLGALAEGFLLGSFDYAEYKGAANAKNDAKKPETIAATIVMSDFARWRDTLHRAVIIAEAQNLARTIASRPGNDINPVSLAALARGLAREVGLDCRILDEKQMQRLGMGGILAVGSGSSVTPPRLIILQHRPGGITESRRRAKAGKKIAPLLVVGKAITFDTGGISIKPADKMGKMIFDKCGGMAVLGLMAAAARLDLPMPIVGMLSAAENHISATAYRPGDIVRMVNGVTVEVTNTDAEGRLVLGDALAWGIDTFKPAAVLDVATLTGGVIIALGRGMAGVMSNDEGLMAELAEAAATAGEKIWRLPLGEEQREQIKSEPADIVNAAGRDGHPLQGAAFLSYFIPEKLPWAHLDIAGVADTEKETPLYAKGATGWGVRTLVEWATRRSVRGE